MIVDTILSMLGLEDLESVTIDKELTIIKDVTISPLIEKIMNTKYLRESVYKLGSFDILLVLRLYNGVRWGFYQVFLSQDLDNVRMRVTLRGEELSDNEGVSFIG